MTTEEKLFTARNLLNEVMQNHRDPNSADYNQCETSPCRWCAEADKIMISEMQQPPEQPTKNEE